MKTEGIQRVVLMPFMLVAGDHAHNDMASDNPDSWKSINVMTYESMLRTFSPEGLWPQDHQWGMHDYTHEGAQGCTDRDRKSVV